MRDPQHLTTPQAPETTVPCAYVLHNVAPHCLSALENVPTFALRCLITCPERLINFGQSPGESGFCVVWLTVVHRQTG
jgi:hypothetical protein